MRGWYAPRLWAVAIAALMAVPIVLGDSSARGAGPEETSWSTFRGDARHSGLSVYSVNLEKDSPEWRLPFESDYFLYWGSGNPTIGTDGTIYLARTNSNQVMAVSWNGSLLWTYDTGIELSDGSAPAISDEGIIHQTAGRSLFAIFPNGTLRWRFDCGGDLCSDPVIADDGMIYVGCRDAKLYAITPDGKERWNFTTNGTVRSSPAVSRDGSIVLAARMGTDVDLVKLDPNGTVRWAMVIPEGHESMSPAIGDDGSVLVYDRRSALYKYHANGTLNWTVLIRHGEEGLRARVKNYEVAFGPDGTIYSGSLDGLYALTSDGRIKWIIENYWGVQSPIVDSDGVIFATALGCIWVVDPQGILLGIYSSARLGDEYGFPGYLTVSANGTIICSTGAGIFAVSGEPSQWPEKKASSEVSALALLVVLALIVLILVVVHVKKARTSQQTGDQTR